MTELEFVRFEVEDFVGTMTLDRPPVNALSRQLVKEIREAAIQMNQEIESGRIRAVILAASGKHFCAGADLKERKNLPEAQVESAVNGIRGAAQAIASIKVPTIAAVQGSAIGGGMELALAADIRIVSDDAKMGLRETALAIIPGAGGTQRLPRLIGYARALEWIASARVYQAAECVEHKVANRMVPLAALQKSVHELARKIADNGPLAVQAAKEAVMRGLQTSLEQGLEIELECYRRTIPTADRREALAAFSEKRPPLFQGN